MYYGYNLLNAYNQVVYIGQTNNYNRRAQEHKEDGKIFSKLTVQAQFLTEKESLDWESRELAVYRLNNHGRNPKYNETLNG